MTACPADAIRIDPQVAEGRPHIVARAAPCVICDDLECMHACPSGALQPVAANQIAMGRAEIDVARCLRGHPDDEDCRLCADHCPIGTEALEIVDGKLAVRDGCTGCGVCESICPTAPASIRVIANEGL